MTDIQDKITGSLKQMDALLDRGFDKAVVVYFDQGSPQIGLGLSVNRKIADKNFGVPEIVETLIKAHQMIETYLDQLAEEYSGPVH